MKRLLLATAAVVALAIAAPMATAQYTTPPPASAPYMTPLPDETNPPQDEALSDERTSPNQAAPQDPAIASSTQPYDVQGQVGVGSAQAQTGIATPVQSYGSTQPYGTQAQASASPQMQPYGAQTQTGQPYSAQGQTAQTTQTYGAQAQTTQSYSTQAQTTQPYGAQPQTYDSQSQPQTYGAMDSQPYAAQSGMGENVATMASLEQHARDAGMQGLPMTAVEVCAPREISLTTSGTRLSRDKQHQLINAADRASVCEIQRLVINSPNGRADAARQLLVEHGVAPNMIDVQEADGAGLEVEMHFAGLATSSEQYAQMFNPQRYADYQPSQTAPGYGANPPASGSNYQPNRAPSGAPSTSGGVWLGDPNAQLPQNPPPESMDDGMSPTSADGTEQTELLDI